MLAPTVPKPYDTKIVCHMATEAASLVKNGGGDITGFTSDFSR